MLDVFNTPTPQTANYQEFYVNDYSGTGSRATWVKPRGVSMVRFLLIGSGGTGGAGGSTNGGGGGGSGAVTSWIGPAIFIPDILNVAVGYARTSASSIATSIYYISSNGSNLLLRANGGGIGLSNGIAGSGASPMTANQFTACGIFNSIGGQSGAAGGTTGAGGSIAPSTSTFLSAGAGGSGGSLNSGGGVTPNYSYTALPVTTAGGTIAGANGYFITQPILVGCGGAGGSTNTTGTGSNGGRGGIGCGGGGAGEDALTGGGRGGDGAVFVWSW